MGEMVHNNRAEMSQFSIKKMEMVIPHWAFKCITYRHKHIHTRRFLCSGFGFTFRCQDFKVSQASGCKAFCLFLSCIIIQRSGFFVVWDF